jgi:hypothetical protein
MNTEIVGTKDGHNVNIYGERVIDCRTGCGRKTTMAGTKLCDNCWELERRIRADPATAMRILEGTGPGALLARRRGEIEHLRSLLEQARSLILHAQLLPKEPLMSQIDEALK